MTTRLRILAASLTLLAANAWAADAAPAAPHTVVLRAARMFDGASGKVVEHPQLTIVGNKIVRIAQGDKSDKADVPAGAEIIDLGDATLLPGFIDAHVHLSGQMSDNWYG